MRTEHEALRDALPAIEAFANGKRVRWVNSETGLSGEWLCCVDCSWFRPDLFWEIEPEPNPPQYREMTADEWFQCWGRVLKTKDGWNGCVVARVHSVTEKHIAIHSPDYFYPSQIEIGNVMKNYTWEDGTPCGVLVE